MNIQDTITQREAVHGEFETYANIMRDLRFALHRAPNIERSLEDPVLKEGLVMILSKIARIANGNPLEPDHWHDIQGYASLVERYIRKTTATTP